MTGRIPLPGRFTPVSFDSLPGWHSDAMLPAFAAFARCAHHVLEKPYRNGALGLSLAAFAEAHEAARKNPARTHGEARRFFEQFFCPLRVAPEDDRGFVTGFYEPEVEASLRQSPDFPVPLYGRPTDLVDVNAGNRPADLDPSFVFARRCESGLREYYDRAAIDRGALTGRGLEIAWLRDRIETYFVHVQGAARLMLAEGGTMRVTYAAKSGHPFTGAGKVLIERGALNPATVTMQTIRAWLKSNPDHVDEVLWENRSYIFFRETALGDPHLGPVAAAKVQLQPGRSIAVDRLLHTFGTPFFIDAPTLRAFGPKPFQRLLIAQDTGSAITGPARGDLFTGTGDEAGEIAGVIKHAADFYALAPKALVEMAV